MFSISTTSINQNNFKNDLTVSQAGAFCLFEGLVRNHNEGRAVSALEYEAAEPLCLNEAKEIMQEAQTKFEILRTKCAHRVGKLSIGDTAVWIGVTSAHRDQAFLACRYLIDEIKSRLPIWKKEYYTDGTHQWVNCLACSGHHNAT